MRNVSPRRLKGPVKRMLFTLVLATACADSGTGDTEKTPQESNMGGQIPIAVTGAGGRPVVAGSGGAPVMGDGGRGGTGGIPVGAGGGSGGSSPQAGGTGGVSPTRDAGPRADGPSTPVDMAPPALRPDGAQAAMPSAGCGQALPLEGLKKFMVGATAREFYLHAPKGYVPTRPYPVVFAFHGASRSGADFQSTGGTFAFRGVMGNEAILAFPNALPQGGGDTAWVRDDLPFFDAVLADISATLCVDKARVFVIGHSSGGFFSNLLACQRGDIVRGFASIAGGLSGTSGCKGNPAAFIVHGLNDTVVKIPAGQGSRDFWGKRNACMLTMPEALAPAPCVAFPGCRPGSPVAYCEHLETAYSNTSHGWPTFATRGLWTFFSAL